ncbi:hypothetical protein [Chryseobacterium geocarposphaerae]|uniref:Lipocalin-like protein n=1 Tax=Chryseobacterium geocarposphaerae TaxID=1416776 RepID=A0A2M9CBE0_9FLAO|nr:hypothetical protein [Chryseobacterium geocarposphaerae]PJJ68145.1 hypothetical protein CLV73_2180 [Chryseobacterium geocarposphaerae]
MKQLFLTAAVATFVVNCSNSDDISSTSQQNNPVTTQYFHPPTWIQGSWKVGNTSYYKFTNDDFIYVMNGTSYKAILTQTASNGQTAKVDETITDTDYNFTITAGASSGTYKFKKISTSQIQWLNGVNNNILDKE